MHWTESYHHQWSLQGVCKDASLTNSLYKLAPAPIPWAVPWGASAGPWVHPQAQLCCPKVAPEGSHSRIYTSQCCGCSLSHQEKLHSLAGSPVSGIPTSSQFNPFCSWASLPTMPDHSCHKSPLVNSNNLNFPVKVTVLLKHSPSQSY